MAMVNYFTKSGTNAFHGDAYEICSGSGSDSVPFTTIGGNNNTYPQGSKVTHLPAMLPNLQKSVDVRLGNAVWVDNS